MQSCGDQLLAGTAFADHEYRFRQGCGTGYVLEHFEENRGFADDRLRFGGVRAMLTRF